MANINNVNNTLAGLTGTGLFVGSTSPTITTPTFTAPVLGTPASGNLVNCTNYPATALTGITAVANGGTGTSTAFTVGSVVFAGSAGVYNQNNANFFWDNTNSRLGINTNAPTFPLTVRAPTYQSSLFRTTSAVDGSCAIRLQTNDVNQYYMELSIGGVGNGLGLNAGQLYVYNATANYLSYDRSGTLFTTGVINSGSSTVVGSGAIATTATSGFLYIPTCPGTPTGVPAAFTGRSAMVYDSTNNILYVYNAGWHAI